MTWGSQSIDEWFDFVRSSANLTSLRSQKH